MRLAFVTRASIVSLALVTAHCKADETEEPKLDPPEFGCSAVDFADASGATDAEKAKVWQIEETTPFQQILDDGTQRGTYDVKIPGDFNAHVEFASGTGVPGATVAITRGEFVTPPTSRFASGAICMGAGSELELGDGPPDTCGEAVVYRRITMRNMLSGACPGLAPVEGELVLTIVH